MQKLIQVLKSQQIVVSKEVQQAMLLTDRQDFCENQPYQDRPQSINFGATISAPHMHAYALELLKDHLINAKRCLDVGSGTGYLTLAFYQMMINSQKDQNDIKSIGIEHIPQLVKLSKENISKKYSNLLNNEKIIIHEGDGRKGCEKYAPYDCIHVGAAAEQIPQDLLDQLANGGRMLIPVGSSGYQDFLVIDKDKKGNITKKKQLGVTYVPLTSKKNQLGYEQ